MRALARRWLFERGGIVVLAALALYLWLSPPFVVTGDNAEFVAIGARGGVPHPSGYPLYVLWLRALAWLPGATPAQTAAYATALLGAAQLYALHAAARAWGASVTAASIAVALYAGSPIVLRLHSEAEVFALNGLIVAVVLWLAAARGPVRGTWRAVLLAVVAGLGLSNHMTCALVAPVGVLGAIVGVRESRHAWPVTVAAALGALVLGLVPYAYFLVAPHNDLSWTYIDDLPTLARHLLRMDYGGPGTLATRGVDVSALTNLAAFVRTVARNWLWVPALLGISALVIASVRPRWLRTAAPESLEPRLGWRLLAASWLLAGPLLVMRFNIDPDGASASIVERFDMLPILLLVPPVALAIDVVITRSRARVLASLPVGAVVAALVVAAAAAPSLARVSALHSPVVEHEIMNLLESLPPNAVMITSPDDLAFGARYAQDVLGVRPDVIAITWPLMTIPVYRARIAARGIALPAVRTELASAEIAEAAFAEGRAVFIDRYQINLARAFPKYPYGPLFRVLPRDSKAPSLDEVVELNRAVFAKYDLAYPKPNAGDGFVAEIQDSYADVWRLLAKALARAGKPGDAAWADDLAHQLAPTPD